jgi:hypothetical protein
MSWPTPRRAPTGLHSLVICRNGVPVLTHHGGGRPPRGDDDRSTSRRPGQWPRLNALSLVPPGARRPGPPGCGTSGPAPGPPVPPTTSPFVLRQAHFLTCLSARSEDPGLVGPVWPRPNAFPIGRDVAARAVQRWRLGHDAVKQCRLTLPSGHANLVARLLNIFSFITPKTSTGWSELRC